MTESASPHNCYRVSISSQLGTESASPHNCDRVSMSSQLGAESASPHNWEQSQHLITFVTEPAFPHTWEQSQHLLTTENRVSISSQLWRSQKVLTKMKTWIRNNWQQSQIQTDSWFLWQPNPYNLWIIQKPNSKILKRQDKFQFSNKICIFENHISTWYLRDRERERERELFMI